MGCNKVGKLKNTDGKARGTKQKTAGFCHCKILGFVLWGLSINYSKSISARLAAICSGLGNNPLSSFGTDLLNE